MSAPTTPLWEVEHPYYCNEGNYFARESVGDEHSSWAEFMEAYGDCDMDMNLVFRWDWDESDAESGEPSFNGDINYRNGILKVFWMGQRKGLYRYTLVQVCRADEPAIRAWLQTRLDHLMRLWAPLTATSS